LPNSRKTLNRPFKACITLANGASPTTAPRDPVSHFVLRPRYGSTWAAQLIPQPQLPRVPVDLT
jgi:hypothetical protein